MSDPAVLQIWSKEPESIESQEYEKFCVGLFSRWDDSIEFMIHRILRGLTAMFGSLGHTAGTRFWIGMRNLWLGDLAAYMILTAKGYTPDYIRDIPEWLQYGLAEVCGVLSAKESFNQDRFQNIIQMWLDGENIMLRWYEWDEETDSKVVVGPVTLQDAITRTFSEAELSEAMVNDAFRVVYEYLFQGKNGFVRDGE